MFCQKNLLKLISIAVLAVGFFMPSQLLAIGLINKPIVINNALRDETIQETLKIFNSEEKEASFDLIAEGDIKDWTSFYLPEDLNNPITKVQAPAQSYYKATVYIKVPEDAANRQYNGQLTIILRPDKEDSEESQASVSQKLSRLVAITVTDMEIIDFNVSVIPHKYGLEENEPLNVRFIYDNQGNVSIAPQIQLKIKKDNKTIYNVIHPYPENKPAVKPLAQYEVSAIEIPTYGFEKGQYVAEISFLHNNKIALEKDFKFSIGTESEGAVLISPILLKAIGAIVIIMVIISIYIKSDYFKKRNNKSRNKS